MSQITYQANPEGILNLDNRTACTGWKEDAAARSFAAGKAAIRVNGVWFAPMPTSSGEPLYMNPHTGAIGPMDEWDYIDESGNTVNAVDLDEVVQVARRYGEWVEL